MTAQTILVLVALALLFVAVVWASRTTRALAESAENRELAHELRYIHARAERGVFRFSDSGICTRLPTPLAHRFLEIAHKWPKHSGEHYYPIPHPTKHPYSAYVQSPRWDLSTEYGRNRLELLDYVISQLDKKNARH